MAKVGRASRNSSLMRVETVSADKTIGDAETGEVYFIDISSSSVVVTLPTPRAGMYFKFIIAVAAHGEATNDFTLTTHDSACDIQGPLVTGNSGAVEIGGFPAAIEHAGTSISRLILDSSEGAVSAGDYLECISDGTDWYVSGVLTEGNKATGAVTPNATAV